MLSVSSIYIRISTRHLLPPICYVCVFFLVLHLTRLITLAFKNNKQKNICQQQVCSSVCLFFNANDCTFALSFLFFTLKKHDFKWVHVQLSDNLLFYICHNKPSPAPFGAFTGLTIVTRTLCFEIVLFHLNIILTVPKRTCCLTLLMPFVLHKLSILLA